MEKNTQTQKNQEKEIKTMGLIDLINQDRFKKTRIKIELTILVILVAIMGYLIYKNLTEKPAERIVEEPKCEVLYENCRNINCRYYDMCNIVDFETCVIYDCGSGIKAEIKDEQGEIITNERPKVDMEEVYSTIQSCKGTTQIITNQCVAGKKELKVKVETKGDCPINAFAVNQGKNDYAAEFEEKDDYFYLTLRNCNKITKLIAIGEKGVLVE
ncbi:MAG: hypothetical protein U9Q16_02135 [Patescibacteria group bacterium]|nr:hypothetical protein [Patescibacteria group bacterium]